MAEANANAGVPRNAVGHGARHYLAINGRVVGYTQNFQPRRQITQTPVDVIDSITTEEHVPTAYTVSATAAIVKVVGRSLRAAGIDVPLEELIASQPRTMTLHDRPTGAVVCTLEGCRLQSASFSVQKGTLTIEQCDFVALRMRDEDGILV